MSHPKLADQVQRTTVALLLTTLLVVGMGVAALLHLSEARGVDRALRAAAHAHVFGEQGGGNWEVEHSRESVVAWTVSTDGDVFIPAAIMAEVKRTEKPAYFDVGDERRLLVLVEQEDEHEEHGEREEADRHDHEAGHASDEVVKLIAARAPAAVWSATVGPFLLTYLGVAALAALLSGAALRRLLTRAFAPLERARAQAAEAAIAGHGTRLEAQGPAEVRDLLTAMNTLLDRLDTTYRGQVRFTAEAAHELRTPVTVMLGELDVALRQARSPEEMAETLGSVREEVHRMRRLVEALTLLARIDGGHVELGKQRIDVADLVVDAVGQERRTLDEAGCELDVELGDPAAIDVHPELMTVALGNLIRNAGRHARGSAVRVTAAVGAQGVTLLVDDDGPGVPEEEREAVFARFARRGASRVADRIGLGLGLPLSREVARRHGGDCTLGQSPGGGCRAILFIPLGAQLTPG